MVCSEQFGSGKVGGFGKRFGCGLSEINIKVLLPSMYPIIGTDPILIPFPPHTCDPPPHHHCQQGIDVTFTG